MNRRQIHGDETTYQLLHWTKGQKASERLAVQILIAQGFQEIDPSHPLGGKDGGKDLIAIKNNIKWIGAVYFPRGQKPFKQIRSKFIKELKGISKNKVNALVFITNQELTLNKRKELVRLGKQNKVEVYHLERIASILNAPANYGTRLEFLEIPMTTEEHVSYMETGGISPTQYAEILRLSTVSILRLENFSEKSEKNELKENKNLATGTNNNYLSMSTFSNLRKAKIFIRNKKYEKAKLLLLELVEPKQYLDEAWYLIGYLYGEREDISSMIDAFNKSLNFSSKFASPIKDYRKYAYQTTFNKGVGFFNAAVKDADHESMIANFKKAIDFFYRSSLCEPSEIGSYENIVSAYLNMNDHDGAIPILQKLTNLGKPAYSFAQLGQIYVINGSKKMESYKVSKDIADRTSGYEWYGKAMDVLKEGAKKYPSDAGILLQLGNAYYLSGNIGKAIFSFKSFVDLRPDNKDVRYAYGIVLLKGKRYKKSVEELSRAISLDETNLDAVYNLAAAYVNWGNDLRERAAVRNPGNKSYLKKFEAAIPYLKQYLSIKPNEAKVWTSLYQIYANLGMKEEAQEAYIKAQT